MSEKILPVLKRHPGRAQATAKRVLQVVHTDVIEVRALARPHPGRRQHATNGLATISEDMSCFNAAAPIDDRAGHVIQDDQTGLAILDPVSGNDEDARATAFRISASALSASGPAR